MSRYLAPLVVALSASAAALVVVGCSSGSSWGSADGGWQGGGADGGSSRQCFGSNDCPLGQQCNVFGMCEAVPSGPPPSSVGDDGGVPTGDMALPPEVVLRVQPPASGKRYVYVAVSSQDEVARIDSVGLEVEVLPVGHDPGVLRTVPGQDVAVVLNRGSSTVTVLRSQPDGSDQVTTLPTTDGLNQLVMSPDGTYAIAYFDVRLTGGNLTPQQSFQELTLIKLAPGKDAAIDLSVGFRPSEIQFSSDARTAFVITEQGVSRLAVDQITKPTIAPTIPLLVDPVKEPVPTQVVVTGDGALALARLPTLSGLRVVDLATGKKSDLLLGSVPTDVELTPDGATAIIALRDTSEVGFAAVPGGLGDATQVARVSTGGAVAGQVTVMPDGAHALLFTNAITQKEILVADVKARALTPLPLKKGVRTVYVAPGGHAAIIVHNKAQQGTPQPTDPVDDFIDKHEAYSLLDVDTLYSKLQLTDAPAGDIAFAPDGSSAYVLLEDSTIGLHAVEAVDLGSFLVTRVSLGSPPIAVGLVPATMQVYVAQDHPLGRMTFIDTTTFKTRTLTGYGLNSQIIE